MKALVLLHDRVIPARTGTRVRNYHLWPAVAKEGVEVRIIGLDLKRDLATAQGPPGVRSDYFGAERDVLPIRVAGALLHTYHQWPRSKRIDEEVGRVIRDWKPDVIHAEELRMASYLPAMRSVQATRDDAGKAVQTLTLHNVESDLLKRTGSTAIKVGRPAIRFFHQMNLKTYENQAVHAVDTVFAYSPADMARYRQLYPRARWSVTANGTNAAGIVPPPLPADRRVLILGTMSYVPNIDGLNWFLDHVRPKLDPDVSVTIAGGNAPQSLRDRLAREPVNYLDSPAELPPLYAAHMVCAVPLLDGSGTRGRILEALAYERPVITTTIGAEGLNIGEGSGILRCDTPEIFAETLNDWTRPNADHLAEAKRGRQFVLDHYDWSIVAKGLVNNWKLCTSH